MKALNESPIGDTATDNTADLPFVSVIVPVFNDGEALHDCLSSLQKQRYPANLFEVLVVDNGSDEDVSGIVDSYQGVRLLREQKVGSYAARNKGIRESAAPVLAFTDADCAASAQWLEAGVARLHQPDSAGVVGGRVDLSFENPKSPNLFELYDAVTFLNQARSVREKGYSVTANLFARREVFDRVGLFDETFRSGSDKEWGGRCVMNGCGPVYAPGAGIMHPARNTFAALIRKTRRVAGGVRSLRQQAPAPWNSGVLRLGGWLLFSPVRKARRAWRHPALSTNRERVGVIAVSWFLTLVSLAEFLRVKWLGDARRS